MNYSPKAQSEAERYAANGYRSADHSVQMVGTRNARPFASPSDEVPETGAAILAKAGIKAPPKVKK